MESKKHKKRQQREHSRQQATKHVTSRAEQIMFCLAARAHDGRGNLIWPDLKWN